MLLHYKTTGDEGPLFKHTLPDIVLQCVDGGSNTDINDANLKIDAMHCRIRTGLEKEGAQSHKVVK